ncbi:uncharacterized protein LOC132385096 isoform X1 [Hypanus sabinus]|uniref:uncharacterized protein LOC132385096 isoform X1 n=1 Tax=Hypanus sabinus TaxID=79690 RepID=UPI0028C467A1|nr:uncharacterized protein LOC132385096 isoform X1 [Hypanus sabinus]
MLGTLMTVLFLISRAVGQFEISMRQRQEPLRYQVFQPLPWQLQSVSCNRKSSRVDKSPSSACISAPSSLILEKDSGSRRSSVNSSKDGTARDFHQLLPLIYTAGQFTGMEHREENICMDPSPERAAVTIQKQYRRYQERKKHEDSP